MDFGAVIGGIPPVAGGPKCEQTRLNKPRNRCAATTKRDPSSNVRIAWCVDGISRTDCSSTCFPVLDRRHGGAVCDPQLGSLSMISTRGRTGLFLHNFPEEPGSSLTLVLDQYFEHDAVLVDCPPQVLPNPTHLDEHFVKMPPATRPGRRPPQPASMVRARTGCTMRGSSRTTPRPHPRFNIG